jgi:hypothetical protein
MLVLFHFRCCTREGDDSPLRVKRHRRSDLLDSFSLNVSAYIIWSAHSNWNGSQKVTTN